MLTPAQQLLRKKLTTGWTVIEKISPKPGSTGGHFSDGYIVVSLDGTRAYLKALDYSEALSSGDPARALQAMTEAYNFERDLLNRFKNSRLNRVVIPLDDGSISVDSSAAGVVQYIIFELAEGDMRTHMGDLLQLDLAWSLRSLHHIATGLNQLHKGDSCEITFGSTYACCSL